nr:hypothetical protein [Mycolicibacterium goodii]
MRYPTFAVSLGTAAVLTMLTACSSAETTQPEETTTTTQAAQPTPGLRAAADQPDVGQRDAELGERHGR